MHGPPKWLCRNSRHHTGAAPDSGPTHPPTKEEHIMTTQPVVFIHGLWIHSSAWEPWATLYRREGFEPIVAGWPGDGATVEETRRDNDRVGGYGVGEGGAHYAALIDGLSALP